MSLLLLLGKRGYDVAPALAGKAKADGGEGRWAGAKAEVRVPS